MKSCKKTTLFFTCLALFSITNCEKNHNELGENEYSLTNEELGSSTEELSRAVYSYSTVNTFDFEPLNDDPAMIWIEQTPRNHSFIHRTEEDQADELLAQFYIPDGKKLKRVDCRVFDNDADSNIAIAISPKSQHGWGWHCGLEYTTGRPGYVDMEIDVLDNETCNKEVNNDPDSADYRVWQVYALFEWDLGSDILLLQCSCAWK